MLRLCMSRLPFQYFIKAHVGFGTAEEEEADELRQSEAVRAWGPVQKLKIIRHGRTDNSKCIGCILE